MKNCNILIRTCVCVCVCACVCVCVCVCVHIISVLFLFLQLSTFRRSKTRINNDMNTYEQDLDNYIRNEQPRPKCTVSENEITLHRL
jgi:hypothetical protein